MNDTRILCKDGHVHTSSRTINEKWSWVSFRLQSTYDGFYVEVDYPKNWVQGFLSWIYRNSIPAYDTLDSYTGMLIMAAESLKFDLFTSLEKVLVEWDILSGSEALLMWERAGRASSARVQNHIVEFVQADPLLVFADKSFFTLPAEMRTLLCKRVSDGRKIKSQRSVYLKNRDSEEDLNETLDGFTLGGLTTSPCGSYGGSMASTMPSVKSPKSSLTPSIGGGSGPSGTGKANHKKNLSVPTDPALVTVQTKSWHLPFSSYNSNCKKVPEEIVLKLREEVRLAAEAKMKALEEAKKEAKTEAEAEGSG